MNKVILMGNLTKDPEIRYTQSADPVTVAKFALAVSRRFKREGEQDTDFINCTVFGKQAEFAEKYLKKGMKIIVSGRLQISQYDNASGQRQWYTDVILDEIEFAESKAGYEARMSQRGQYDDPQPQPQPSGGYHDKKTAAAPAQSFEPEGFSAITESIDDDDLPF
jgi:single-strand DNA-binding protein